MALDTVPATTHATNHKETTTMATHEIRRGTTVLETVEGERADAERRAYELGGLSYEIRNPEWHETDHRDFACSEDACGNLLIATPVGTFRLPAKRREGQESLPVRICGRLCEPDRVSGWLFQPSSIEYADGTHSAFLGCYPRDLHLVGE